MKKLFPDLYLSQIKELTPSLCAQRGIKGIVFDIDNTLAPYGQKTCPDDVEAYLSSLESAGIAVGYASNNNEKRVNTFNTKGRFFTARAGKPGSLGITRFLAYSGLSADEVALAGDQLFTDVWCAKRSGVTSVLVPPISRKGEPWYFVFKRAGEGIILRAYKRSKRKGR